MSSEKRIHCESLVEIIQFRSREIAIHQRIDLINVIPKEINIDSTASTKSLTKNEFFFWFSLVSWCLPKSGIHS